MKSILYSIAISISILLTTSCQPKWSETTNGDISMVNNEGGKSLGYSINSGVKILKQDRFAFKDLNQNGTIEPYEDWRLAAQERAEDLASRMSIEQIAGLMLYSGHQAIPAGGYRRGTYGGKPFEESNANPSDLSDQQIEFLAKDGLRHVLITSVESPEIAATWNNNVQSLVEGIGLGIPANNSSDPRHGTASTAEFNLGAGGQISTWPSSLGLAATFDPDLVRNFGEMASKEYRGLGITTALSPQIDLASEPRWYRYSGTFGSNTKLVTDMAEAYVDGFQSTNDNGWGYESVNTMVKHWPGGGSGEGGRDAHFGYGAYAVYPGNNFADHLKPFTEGAFKLSGGTGMASAVMPYYTISVRENGDGENVANAYNKYLITDLLRGEYGYDGVICTDWLVTGDVTSIYKFEGKPWGVEDLTLAERHYKAIVAGVDQFGGNNEMEPIIEAHAMGIAEFGEDYMRDRFEKSAIRLLKNIFRTGLFENPYLDVNDTKELVGNKDFMTAGFEAQLKSIVMLKNQGAALPVDKLKKVYIPNRTVPAQTNWFGRETPEKLEFPTNAEIAEKYFTLTDDPDEADFSLVFIESPKSGVGYDDNDRKNGGNGYMPINLQYQPYTATQARKTSLAGGSPFEDFTNRSYQGKTISTTNVTDLDLVLETKKKMGERPVIVSINMKNPTVMAEFEPYADAILVSFDVQHQAIFEIMAGNSEPSGLLPMQLPANMSTVELQQEDVPLDMEPYADVEGHLYDFGFGMNWNGVLNDERTIKYNK